MVVKEGWKQHDRYDVVELEACDIQDSWVRGSIAFIALQ